jgi:hypothetical protein
MLLCVCLNRGKGSINVRIDSLRWHSERHCGSGGGGGGGGGGGRKLGIALKTGGSGSGSDSLTRIEYLQ